MTAHPIHAVFVDGTPVSKDDAREEVKQYPREFLTATAVRTYDLDNTPNVLIAGKLFAYDSTDTTTADDGVFCVHDLTHRRFKIIPASVVGSTAFIASAIAGTANSIDATVPGLSALSSTPQFVWVTPALNNTTTAQIKFNGGSYVPLVRDDGTALSANDVVADHKLLLAATSTSAQIWTANMRATHTGLQTASTISDFTEAAQDAVGAAFDSTLVYTDGSNAMGRAAITGHVAISAGSNTAALGNFTKAELDTAVSDGNVSYVGHAHTASDVTDFTEATQDVIGALFSSGTEFTYTYNDAANTFVVTLSTAGIANGKLANMAAHTIKANVTGSSAAPVDSTLSAILDAELGSTQGLFIVRKGTGWSVIGPGTTGQVPTSQGAGADPIMATPSGSGGSPGGSSGDIQVNNSGAFAGLTDQALFNRLLGRSLAMSLGGGRAAYLGSPS